MTLTAKLAEVLYTHTVQRRLKPRHNTHGQVENKPWHKRKQATWRHRTYYSTAVRAVVVVRKLRSVDLIGGVTVLRKQGNDDVLLCLARLSTPQHVIMIRSGKHVSLKESSLQELIPFYVKWMMPGRCFKTHRDTVHISYCSGSLHHSYFISLLNSELHHDNKWGPK